MDQKNSNDAPASSVAKIAIVGRPNVGKSSLFNRFIQRRDALVHDQPGVTRDRIYGRVEWSGKSFEIIDTGGLEPGTTEPLKHLVQRQVQFALDEAGLILFVVDGPQGQTAMDRYISQLLHKTGKPVLLVVNKIDQPNRAPLVADFYQLGFPDPIWVSAQHGTRIGDLLDLMIDRLEQIPRIENEQASVGVKVTLLGKPNAGKSTLINSLLGEERVLVHSEPGTTRDSIVVPFQYDERPYTLVDTAGIRKKLANATAVEKLSVMAAKKALERADLAVLILDAERGLDTQDKRVAGLIQEANKPCVVAINKWDAIEDKRGARSTWERRLSEELFFLSFCPHLYISGLQGQNLAELMKAVDRVNANRSLFIQAKKLTSMVKEASIIHQPPSHAGRKLAVYYVSQLKNQMATFVFKVNDSKLIHFSYERYIENTFRQTLGFEGIPMTFVFKDKERKGKGS